MNIQANHQQRNPGLDVMRSLCIVLVVVQHSFLFTDTFFPQIRIVGLFNNTMVDVFFVLSGFLIASIFYPELTGEKTLTTTKIKRFYIRRWFKTLPMYYLSVGLFYLLTVSNTYVAPDFSWKFLVFLQNLESGMFVFMSHSYTLAIEEWFYLLLPLFIGVAALLGSRIRGSRPWLLPVLWIAVGILARWYIHHQGVEHWDLDIRKALLARLDAPVYGVLAYLLYMKYQAWMNQKRVILLVVALVIQLLITMLWRWEVSSFFTDVLYFTLLPLSFCLWFPWFCCLNVPRWMQALTSVLSQATYAIYLLHLPLLTIFIQWFEPQSSLWALIYFLLAVLLNILIGVAVWRFIERPIMNLRERF